MCGRTLLDGQGPGTKCETKIQTGRPVGDSQGSVAPVSAVGALFILVPTFLERKKWGILLESIYLKPHFN